MQHIVYPHAHYVLYAPSNSRKNPVLFVCQYAMSSKDNADLCFKSIDNISGLLILKLRMSFYITNFDEMIPSLLEFVNGIEMVWASNMCDVRRRRYIPNGLPNVVFNSSC